MLNIHEATIIVKRNIPDGNIQAVVEYKNLYLFQVFTDDPLEGEMDPFFSVNRSTGEFSDFSIITDGDTEEIVSLFKKVKNIK